MTPVRLQLRELREQRELSQQELALRVGVRQATISDLETGKAKVLRLQLLEALARELGVSARELILETAPEPKRRHELPARDGKRNRGR